MDNINNINNMDNINNIGRLDIIIGCMFSGKTTELISRIKNARIIYDNIIVVNHSFDTRYDTQNICSHDYEKTRAVSVHTLHELIYNINYVNCKAIFIDEAQLFDDLKSFVTKAVDIDNKFVTICGLDGDFRRHSFGQILELVPFCDSIMKLTAICVECKNKTLAIFSKRITESEKQILIGDKEYKPVCRYHYINK
jgi:thymidine kinase